MDVADVTYLEDNDSRFGTYVDGERLKPKQKYEVPQGEHTLKLANLEFRLEIL